MQKDQSRVEHPRTKSDALNVAVVGALVAGAFTVIAALIPVVVSLYEWKPTPPEIRSGPIEPDKTPWTDAKPEQELPPTVLLVNKARVGATTFYKVTSEFNGKLKVSDGDVMREGPLTISGMLVFKATVDEVTPSGNITRTVAIEEGAITRVFGGTHHKDEGGKLKLVTETFRPDGLIISSIPHDGSSSNSNDGPPMAVIFPQGAVGIGDKWNHHSDADSLVGSRATETTYELLGFEEKGGVRTAKIGMIGRELGSPPGSTSKGTVWVEISSGDLVLLELNLRNTRLAAPIGKGMGSGKIVFERISGSPLTVLSK